MDMATVQGQPLEVTVIACKGLKNTEWISRQDPYVCLEYGSTKCRTKTCTDGGRNPRFEEKFTFPLIEGVDEMNLVVWNSNTVSDDDFIGSGKIQLNKAITQGYDDTRWPLSTRSGKHAGEVKMIIRNVDNTELASPANEHMPPVAYPAPDQAPSQQQHGYGGYPRPQPSGYPQPSPAYPPAADPHPYGTPPPPGPYCIGSSQGPYPYGAPPPGQHPHWVPPGPYYYSASPGPYPYGAAPGQYGYVVPPGQHPYGAPPGQHHYGAPPQGHGHSGLNNLTNMIPSSASELVTKMLKMKMKL